MRIVDDVSIPFLLEKKVEENVVCKSNESPKEVLSTVLEAGVKTEEEGRNPTQLELETVRRYSLTGSMAKVAREMNLPLYELNKLSRTNWWQEELVGLRREEMAQINASLTNLFDKTIQQIGDRLEKGDYVMSQGGKLRRVPVSASTLARLADVIFDKRQLVRNEPTIIAGDNTKLARLADKLRQLGQARTIEATSEQVVSIQ